MSKTATKQTATIDCPRCGGHGHGSWKPDQGICYRCKGRKVVTINIPRHAAALRHLRAKYVRLRDELAAADADTKALLQEQLNNCTADGTRCRAELEAAQAAVR